MTTAIVVLLLVNVILTALLIFCNEPRTGDEQVVMNFLVVNRAQEYHCYSDSAGTKFLPAAVRIRAAYAQTIDSPVLRRDDLAGHRVLVGERWDGKLLREAQNNGAITRRTDSYI